MFNHGLGASWLIVAVVIVIPFWRICAKAGYSPWLGLLAVVPLVNLFLIYFLAFSEWPSQKGRATPGVTPGPTPA
jgi:hypothetical protein